MSAEQVGDGNLPAALVRLTNAIHALTSPQQSYIEGQHRIAPSLYMQLWDATAGSQGTDMGTHARSMPTVWLDALQIRMEIDTALEVWQPQYTGTPPTVGRLKWLANKSWRPQDVRNIDQISAACEEWAKDITALLYPEPKWTLPTPCPACNSAVVYRKDSGGERVRQPALQIGPQGCFCANCKAYWGPDKFMWLSKLLGFEKPAGLLE